MVAQSKPPPDTGLTAKPSLTIKRRFNAAPRKSLRRVDRPGKTRAWFGPAKAGGSLQADIDLRVGGRYRITSMPPTASISRSAASIAKSCRTNGWYQLGLALDAGAQSLVTISLKPDGAGTLLTLHHEQFFDEAARDAIKRDGRNCSSTSKILELSWLILNTELLMQPHGIVSREDGLPPARPISRMRRN